VKGKYTVSKPKVIVDWRARAKELEVATEVFRKALIPFANVGLGNNSPGSIQQVHFARAARAVQEHGER
jgi:hypothetical protein